MRQFKLSKDPLFAAKVRDIVGLYVDPPAHAIVLTWTANSGKNFAAVKPGRQVLESVR